MKKLKPVIKSEMSEAKLLLLCKIFYPENKWGSKKWYKYDINNGRKRYEPDVHSDDKKLIFEYEGEIGFRKREESVLKDLVFYKNIVLATGGGIILSENNRKLLIDNGCVIYLKSTCEDLVERMVGDKSRPLLQNVNLKETLESLFESRNPLYTSTSDYIIETKNKRANEIATEIQSVIKQKI